MFDVSESFDTLTREMLERSDPDRVEAAEAYMRNQFGFMGTSMPHVREAIKPIANAAKDAGADQLVRFVDLCWDADEREFQQAGALMLRRRVGELNAPNLDDVRRYIANKSWWDTVDGIAAHTVGPMVRSFPELVATMDAWVDDDNMWLRRTAILHQLMYKDATDADRLFDYCLRRAHETEFFIRKAIGWALRQYGRTEPDLVRTFVHDHDTEWSGLTRREALKHL